ncbi:hypothetical protein I4U23_022601 [Adineta vaga]|nr:hypothetical protein I4U23_022601 [Adineta vaga]
MSDLDDERRTLIPHLSCELTLHCIYKGFQLGSTVTLITVLSYQLYKSKKNPSFIPILSRCCFNEYKIWDRAYRLRHSQTQNRVDKFTFISSIAGGLTGLLYWITIKK